MCIGKGIRTVRYSSGQRDEPVKKEKSGSPTTEGDAYTIKNDISNNSILVLCRE